MITPHGDPLGRIGDPDIGGQCIYVRELSAHLAKAGHEVIVFTRDRGEGKPPREEHVPGATVVRIPCGPAGFIPKEDFLPILPEFIEHLDAELVGGEILHSHYWDGGYAAAPLRTDRRWFHTTHSIGKLKQAALPNGAAYRYEDRIRVESEIYRGCDRVVALTKRERSQIGDLYEVSPDRIAVIPPGVNTEVFTPPEDRALLRRRLDLPEQATIVFTLGRLDERKGFDLYLEALGRLRRRTDLGEVLFLLSAGGSSPQEAEHRAMLEGILDAHDLRSVFHWLPVLPETQVPNYYAASDVFVLPSRYEPFGIVMLEAMACALPVVATDAGGPATVIEPGQTGLLVDPTDTDAMADALAEMILDPEGRRELGERGRLLVESSYSWERIAARHIDEYRNHDSTLAKDGLHAG